MVYNGVLILKCCQQIFRFLPHHVSAMKSCRWLGCDENVEAADKNDILHHPHSKTDPLILEVKGIRGEPFNQQNQSHSSVKALIFLKQSAGNY